MMNIDNLFQFKLSFFLFILKKPNNIIVLNHFASCLFKAKVFSFEESRLILNFMFNNFDYLFTLPKNLQEIINKRQNFMQKYGSEELFMGKTNYV